jgi:hypothetical protein
VCSCKIPIETYPENAEWGPLFWKILHGLAEKSGKQTNINIQNLNEIRFTKVLTKYSTEYNNSLFIQKLCQKLGTDKKDLFVFFLDFKNNYDNNQNASLLESYEINKLDINRIYRYIEKYIKENATGTTDKEIDEESCDDYDDDNELDY